MKTRVLLFLIFAIMVFALGTVVTVLFNTAPTSNDIVALFYISLFCTLFGITFFAVYSVSYLRLQALPDWQSTASALRLATVLAALISALLLIRSVNLLNAATFIILIILAVASELILRRRSALKG